MPVSTTITHATCPVAHRHCCAPSAILQCVISIELNHFQFFRIGISNSIAPNKNINKVNNISYVNVSTSIYIGSHVALSVVAHEEVNEVSHIGDIYIIIPVDIMGNISCLQ